MSDYLASSFPVKKLRLKNSNSILMVMVVVVVVMMVVFSSCNRSKVKSNPASAGSAPQPTLAQNAPAARNGGRHSHFLAEALPLILGLLPVLLLLFLLDHPRAGWLVGRDSPLAESPGPLAESLGFSG